MLEKVGKKSFSKYTRAVLVGFTLITSVFAYYLFSLNVDYDFEKFFPKNDEETAFFIEHRAKFESDNDFLLIAIERKQGIFDKEFLINVDSLTSEINRLPNVQNAASITQMEEIFFLRGGLGGETQSSRKYIDFEDFDPVRDSTSIYENEELVEAFVASDGKSLCIFLNHDQFLSKEKSDKLIVNLNKLIEKYPFEKVRMAGRTIGQKFYIDQMSVEMVLFVALGAIMVLIFLFIAFRSVWGVLIPQAVIAGTMIWLMGGMGAFNTPINILLTTTPSVMFVVSMSDVIHLVSRYLDALRDGLEKFDAIKKSIKEVGMATLLTSITTAIGFFTLIFVQVEPIQKFGIVIGSGVLIAFVLTYLLLPVLFFITMPPKYILKNNEDHFWKKHLHKWFGVVLRKRITIGFISIIVVAISILGITKLESNNFLMDDLAEDEPLKEDFNFLEDNYGGARPYELAVIVKDTNLSVWDLDVLNEVAKVESFMEKEFDLVVKGSLVQLLKIMNRGAHLGDTTHYILPEKKKTIRKRRKAIRIADQGKFVKTIVDSTERTMRISGTIGDISNNVVTAKNEKLLAFCAKNNLNGKIEYKITGTAHLLDKNMSYLASSMVKGLTISVLIVALLIGLIYRSIPILIISIVTNIFPLVFIAGLMGYLGIELKTSTAIIFTIAFGIAVDDTIHFLGKFKHELMKGRSKLYALKRSYMTTGKAMILTSLILCAGFIMLVFSSFLGSFYLGVMLCITLLVALIADITLLPVLLLFFYKDKKSKNT